MDEAQFNEQTKGCTEQRDVSVRQVRGGYVLGGVRRFLQPGTDAIKLAQQSETVASDADAVAAHVGAFLDTGSFEG